MGHNITQSRLLSPPPEIRNRVYKLVLGGNTIYITVPETREHRLAAERKLCVCICKANPDDAEVASVIRHCSEATDVGTYGGRHAGCSYHGVVSRDVERYSVALLQTCRQVHFEAALLPFQENTFSMSLKEDFVTLLNDTRATKTDRITEPRLPTSGQQHNTESNEGIEGGEFVR